LPELAPSVQSAVREALSTGRLPKPGVIARLSGGGGTLLGAAPEAKSFALLGPAGTVVESDSPTLRWQPLQGAREYRVTISDDDLNEVADSGPLAANRHPSPNSWTAPRLKRGLVYFWQVTARAADGAEVTSPQPPAPPAKFKVLDARDAAELSAARAKYADSRLALAVLFARAGLLEEAAHELELLRRANPDSAVLRRLLEDLKSAK
jgi:hypothetical protein